MSALVKQCFDEVGPGRIDQRSRPLVFNSHMHVASQTIVESSHLRKGINKFGGHRTEDSQGANRVRS